MDSLGRSTPDLDMPVELLALRREFLERLDGRIEGIWAQYRRLSPESWVLAEVATLHRMVHSLTGSAGTFGMPLLSQAARQLEGQLAALLQHAEAPDADAWSAIGFHIGQLEVAGQQRPVDPPGASVRRIEPKLVDVSSPLIHLVQSDAAQAAQLDQSLREAGYQIRSFAGLRAWRNAYADRASILADRPAALVLDLALKADDSDRNAMMQALGLGRHGDLHIPVVTTLVEDTLAERLSAIRVGVNRTLPRPLQAACLLDALDGLTTRESQVPWRVLLVDDDEIVLEAHATVLRAAGMEVRTLSQALQTLVAVEEFRPDVLLLDVYMPEARGPEVAAALREGDAQLHLPILFLSAETDMTQQLLALNLGGDDFLIKPVLPEHLVAAVTARARRARQNKLVQIRLESALYERQQEHLALDQHAIVSVADQDGLITYANGLFCSISGYGRSELIGRNHRLLESNVHPPGFTRAIWESISRGMVWHGEVCSRRKDGTLYWTEVTVTPFLDETGHPYQYVVIQTDISHIKAAEEAQRRQLEMQRMTSVAAARLMAAPARETGQAINEALRDSGMQLGADRAYLFGFSRDGARMSNIYEWYSAEHPTVPEALLHESLDSTPWMRDRFLREGMVVVPDVSALPTEADDDRRLLEARKVGALLVIPLQINGQLSGFLSYSCTHSKPDWTIAQVELMKVLTEVVGSALARRRSELALRESEARLNFLVSSSPVTIFTCAPRPPFSATYLSPNVTHLLGFEPGEFSQAPGLWAERIHPDDRTLVLKELSRLFHLNKHQHEYRWLSGEGQYRWIHGHLRLVRDDAGEPVEIIGYLMDITERKHIEQQLFEFNCELEQRVAEQTQSVIESERMARATLDALSSRVVILDDQGVILAANHAWAESAPICNRTGDALGEGANYLACMDQNPGTVLNDLNSMAAGIRAVLNGETREFFHEYVDQSAGDPRWFICRVERFPGDGAVRAVVSHENITQMKLIERQQMRSQRLESLGTLAGGVAHDLNNALAPILMGMELLKSEYPDESQVLEMVQNSARRGADMVRQLLTFAKGADGERAAVRPDRLVRELESLMKGSFPKNIEIQALTESPLDAVMGDVTQLHQILLNLCVNARDAMPDGGTLAISARMAAIDERQARTIEGALPGRYVALSVRDSGTGIPPDVLERIFDPFYTTKSPDKGTGLGLSTVLGIIRSHKGFVQVRSKPGKGSSFEVYLPAVQNAEETAPAELTDIEFRGHGERILFVDDERAVREVAASVLRRLNFEPLLATDGADALIQAAQHRADLQVVVTDLHMPHMDGLAFIRALRRILPGMPVVVASGRIDEQSGEELRKLDVLSRLHKPFTEEQLSNALEAALRRLGSGAPEAGNPPSPLGRYS